MRKGEKESVEGKVKKNIDNNHSITVEHSIESNGSSAVNQYVPVISIKTISSHEKGEASTKIEKPTSGNGNHYQPTTFDDEDVDEEEDTEGEIIDDERRRRDRVIELDKFFNDMNLFGKRTNKPDEINRPYSPKSRNVDFFKLDNLDNFFDMNLF
ncbi:hypothetical protein RDWZM_003284 [Blomia tropicalis]|uniref:Uncharacterized protein n=1 Tax=Blomia tropicalis TaxID=40697 RepID=A0A9Q0RSD7_BLOTA|nr:hypothetical protein RDWZM_003284 [Blomia tropicalis]